MREAQDGLSKAIDLLGGINGLARALDEKPATVSAWKQRGKRRGRVVVPAEHCPSIELVTGGQVTCEELNPDVKWWVLRQAANDPAHGAPRDSVVQGRAA